MFTLMIEVQELVQSRLVFLHRTEIVMNSSKGEACLCPALLLVYALLSLIAEVTLMLVPAPNRKLLVMKFRALTPDLADRF